MRPPFPRAATAAACALLLSIAGPSFAEKSGGGRNGAAASLTRRGPGVGNFGGAAAAPPRSAPFRRHPRGGAAAEARGVATLRGGQEGTGGGTATVSDEIINMVKTMLGAGVLSLPAGIAAFGDGPGAVLPGMALIVAIGAVSAYMFSLIGRTCAITGATSYSDAWDRTVSPKTSFLPAGSSTFSWYV